MLRDRLVATLLGFGALLVVPLDLPLRPPARMAAFPARLRLAPVVGTNRAERLQLPQDYPDMLGWEEPVHALVRVYDSLPAAKRSTAVLFGTNYGEACAIDFFGPGLRLPPVVVMPGVSGSSTREPGLAGY